MSQDSAAFARTKTNRGCLEEMSGDVSREFQIRQCKTKSLAGKVIDDQAIAGKCRAGQGIAGKSIAGKSTDGKTMACKLGAEN